MSGTVAATTVGRVIATAKAIVSRAREAQLSFLAASLAYYMLVSLFPLGLLAFVVASWVGGAAFADSVIAIVSAFLSPTGTQLLDEALQSGAGQGGATLAGVALLLWGGLRVFRGLDVAFTLAYGRDQPGSLPEQFLDATVALLGIGVAIGALVAVNAALALADLSPTDAVGTLLLVLALFVAFYPFYYVFPDVGLDYRDPIPGAAFAAVGWTLLGATFSLYAANAGSFALYGAIGAVLLLVTWFYFAGAILLLGAVINAVIAGVEPDVETADRRTLAEASVGDRQRQKVAARTSGAMSDDAGTAADEAAAGDRDGGAGAADRTVTDDVADEAEVERLREELAELREEVDEKSLPRDELESDLRRYVRARVRRGKARGWGPYLVLLYGTAMTIAAFWYLSDLVAVFAMFVIWLSTLGLYALMLIVGAGVHAAGLPGRAVGWVRSKR